MGKAQKRDKVNKTEDIKELAVALSKAQAEISGAHKDKDNPFFKSKYADLASVWDACRNALTSNGLSIVQLPGRGEGAQVTCETVLIHSSGQSISSMMSMTPAKTDPQGIGSCLTYLRRYTLSAMVGVAPEDDDGNGASEKAYQASKSTKKTKEDQVEPGNKNAFQMHLEKMANAKKYHGDEIYYDFLKNLKGPNGEVMGYKHANQITSLKMQEKAYDGLLALAKGGS